MNVTIKLTNRATNHTNADSLDKSFKIQFNDSAFTPNTAATIDGSTRDDLSITFYDPVAMTYEPGSFTEAPINDGSITDTRTIFLEGASFRNGEFEDADYSSNCSSILPGLRLKLYRVSEHQAMIKLEGNATSHAVTNSLANLNISFRQTAFKNFTGNVAQFSKNDMKVEFIDAKPIRILEVYPSAIGGGTFNSSTGKYSSVKYQGDYKDVTAALNGLSGYEITSMSLNKFISLVEDVNGQYDIVYFGRGTYFKNAADTKRYGNDITDKRAREVLRFINSGQLCIFHPDAFKADPVDNKYDTKMYRNFYSVTKNNVIRLANGTTDPNTSNRLKNAILTYTDASVTSINKKPVLSVYEKPLSYKNLTNPLESRYIGYDFKVYDKEDETVKAKLYIDRNNDSLFEEKELVEEKTVNSRQAASILYKMPDGLTGIFFWKLEIEDSKGAKDEMVDVFRLLGDEINVKVLQITPNSMSVNGSLTAMFNRPFDGEPGNTLGHRKGEYKVDVVEVTLDQFNTGANSPNHLGSELNAYYDMIVIGFQDSYGQNVFNANALARLDSFIKTNQGVMFTHDTIWDRDKTSLTTSFMDETAQTSAYNAGIVTYSARKDSSSYSNYFTEVGGYDKVNEDYKLDEFRNVDPTNVATLIRKVNSAAITLYPFNLEDTPQTSMTVAPTHFQWYKLDLEQEGVIPLFNMYSSKNSERINDDGMNGFYTYSNGNITYSGTGHATASTPYPDYEVKLFVNTMMKAYSSQNHKPEIEIISPENQKRVSAGESHVDVRFRAYDFDFGDDVLDYKVYIDRGAGYEEAGSGSMDNGSAVSLSVEKKFTNARTFMVKISVQDRGNNGTYTPAENYVELTLYNVDAPLITPSISFANDKLLVGESIHMNVLATSKGSANPTITIQPKLTSTIPKGLTYGGSRDGSTVTTLTQTFSYTPTGASPTSAVVGTYSIGTYQLDQDANEKSFTFSSSIDMQNGTSANNAAGSVNVRSASLKVEAKDNFGSGNYLRDYTLSGVGSARVKKVGGTYVYMDISGGNGKEFVLNVPTGYTFERLELYRNESANPDGENWVAYNDGIPDTENRIKIDINYDNYRWKVVYHLKLNIQKVPVSYYRVVTPYNDVDFIGTDPGDLTADPLYQLPVKRGSKVLLAALFKIDPIIGTNVTDLEIGVEAKDKYGNIIPTGAATAAKILDTNITFANTSDTAVFRTASTRWLKSNPDALTTGTYADGTYYVLIEIPKADEQQIRMSSLKLIMDNGSTPTFYTSEIGLISITDLEVPPLR